MDDTYCDCGNERENDSELCYYCNLKDNIIIDIIDDIPKERVVENRVRFYNMDNRRVIVPDFLLRVNFVVSKSIDPETVQENGSTND